ncbi:MAG: Flagellar hook-associated protein 3 [Fimbriimonadaceae bacterium]|nr:Flagellar hook-associated protein 3 [Fimbriimonadaceae bacterium]
MDRIGFLHQTETYASQIRSAQARYAAIQRQVMSGKRIESMSDDAIGARSILSTKALKGAAERFQKNTDVGIASLKFSESALGDIDGIMRRAYERAVFAANTSTSQEGREAIAQEIVTLQQRLIDLGNTKSGNGDYIFAGQMVDTKPFTVAGSTLNYNGDNNLRVVEVEVAETVPISTMAGSLVQDAYTALEGLRINLIGGNISAISGVDIQLLQDSSTAVGLARAEAGSRLTMLEARNDLHSRRIDEFTVQISDIEEIDISEAIVKYQAAETAYTAALQVTSQAYQLSLMDFLR